MECMAHHCSDRLLVLELDGAELSDESIAFLSRCTKLTRLSISFAELLTDDCLPYFKVR